MTLSPECLDRLEFLFPHEKNQDEVRRILEEGCSPSCDWFPKEQVDRIRCAVLRLSRGRLDQFEDAMKLAPTGYRDLLMAADFGRNVDSYRTWHPRDHAV